MKIPLIALLTLIALPATAQTWTVSPSNGGQSYTVRGSDGSLTTYSGNGTGNYTVSSPNGSGNYNISTDHHGGYTIRDNGADFQLPGGFVPPQ